MMDYRLSNITDPDPRMAINEGTKEKPIWKSRISKLTPDKIGYQKINSVKYNGQDAPFKVEGTLLERSTFLNL